MRHEVVGGSRPRREKYLSRLTVVRPLLAPRHTLVDGCDVLRWNVVSRYIGQLTRQHAHVMAIAIHQALDERPDVVTSPVPFFPGRPRASRHRTRKAARGAFRIDRL